MFKRTITVLAFAIFVITNPFKVSSQINGISSNSSAGNEQVNLLLERAIDELKNENLKLSEKSAELESRLNQIENHLELCLMSYNSSLSSSELREIRSADAPKLEQNTPNPFKEKTVIKYYVPSKATDAYIKIYSLFGSELLSFPLAEKGFSQVEFSGKTPSAGTFTYILIVDEKAVDTKNMVLTR